MRKSILAVIMTFTLAFTICACGDSADNGNSEKNAQKAVERDLPEGDYEDVGSGRLYLVNESGSTENGDEIVVYPDMNSIPFAYVDYELWDMDGSILTYIYLDGVQMDKQQIGEGYQASLSLEKKWQVKEGKHVVEAVQYADNDPKGEITFYRGESFEVKAE